MMGIATLIVDDDDLTLFLHQIFVKENHFDDNPKTFQNGQQLLDYLSSHHADSEEFCILLDLNMPVLNGWEFLDMLKDEEYKDKVKVAILTSSVNESDKQKAKEYKQVVTFVEKPLTDKKIASLKQLDAFKEYYQN